MSEPFDPAHDEFLYHQRKEQEAAETSAASPVDTAVDDLLARCRKLSDEADLLDSALTIEYVRYRSVMEAEFSWEELNALKLDITSYGVTLAPEDCTDDYFSFQYLDREGCRDETRLPIAFLRDMWAFVAKQRGRIPEKRQESHARQVAEAQKERDRAQARLDRLTGRQP